MAARVTRDAYQRGNGDLGGRHGLQRVAGQRPELDMLDAAADDGAVSQGAYFRIKDLREPGRRGGGGGGISLAALAMAIKLLCLGAETHALVVPCHRGEQLPLPPVPHANLVRVLEAAGDEKLRLGGRRRSMWKDCVDADL